MSDWLDIPNGKALVREALNDDTTPKVRDVVLPAGLDPQYVAMIKSLRRLRPKQRTYIRALLEAKGHNPTALRILRDMFMPIDHTTVSRWYRNAEFAQAVALMKKHALRLAGIDPIDLMIKTGAILDEAMTPVEVLDREGKPTGILRNDPTTALRSVEILGKFQGMTRDAETTRVTLEIVNLANRGETIDGEAEEIE